MMTIVESIDVFCDMRESNSSLTEKQKEAVDTAICFMMAFDEDHKYRTPKKPIKIRISGFYQCPECGRILNYEEGLYCAACGQALDWKVEK